MKKNCDLLPPTIETIDNNQWIEIVKILFQELKRVFLEKEYYCFPSPPADDCSNPDEDAITTNDGGKAVEEYLRFRGSSSDRCLVISKDEEPHYLCSEIARKEYDNEGWPISLTIGKCHTFIIPDWAWSNKIIDRKWFQLSPKSLVETYRYYFEPLLDFNFAIETPGQHNVFERIIYGVPDFYDMRTAEVILQKNNLLIEIKNVADHGDNQLTTKNRFFNKIPSNIKTFALNVHSLIENERKSLKTWIEKQALSVKDQTEVFLKINPKARNTDIADVLDKKPFQISRARKELGYPAQK